MYTPPRATAAPTAAIIRRARLPFLYFLLFLFPLVLLAATTHPARAADVCTTDTAGANDEPGQKDLTQFCSDDAGLPSVLAVKWQWDQTGWSGSNTGDACALFDTDGDGNANYSLCTVVSGTPAAYQAQQLHQCSDSRPERCMGAVPIPSTSVCSAEVQGTPVLPGDPFPSGSDYPRDTVGTCNVNLVDIAGGTAQMIDVCSYPSQQPNSDPSDCVVYRANTGRLEVRKALRPSYNPGRFNLLIDSNIEASAVGDGGTTGEKIVDAGQHSVSETTATNTNLGDYNTSIECRDANGTGSVIASQANNSPLALTVPDGSDIVCTITNERQTGTIYVTKVVDWNGIPVDKSEAFEICIYGPSYPNGNCKTTGYDGGLLTWAGVETGFYDVVESDLGGAWSVVVDTSPVSVPCNGSVSATVTNTRRRGSLEVTKFVNWNGATQDLGKTFAICITGPSYGAPNCQNVDFDGGVLLWPDLIPGDYTVTESDPGSQWSVTVTDSPVTVPDDGTTAKASVANSLKRGSLTVTKVANWNGVTPDQGQTFTLCITGPSYPGGSCQDTGYLGGALSWTDLLPGTYTVGETDAGPLWTTSVSGSPVTVVSGDTGAAAAVVNTRKLGRLEVTKAVNWNGAPVDASQSFQICIAGPTYPDGDCQSVGSSGGLLAWGNLIPGTYVVSENDPGSMWVVEVPDGAIIVPGDGGGAKTAVTNTHKRGSLEVDKIVDWNGSAVDGTQNFQICITGPSHLDDSCQAIGAGGGPLMWHDLVPGDYTVSEKGAGTQWITTVAGSPATVVGDGSTTTASVTNTRKRGSLTVTKVVEWNGVTPDTAQTFQICITGPSYPDGGCQAAPYNGGALVWNGLIPGDYSVSEVALGSEWIVTIDNAQVTVPRDGSPASASVVNMRKLGGLNVTKVVNWNSIVPDETRSFEICIAGASFPDGSCQTADYDGATLAWTGLIPGDYQVYETAPGSEWTVTVDSATATVPTNGGAGDAAVTNTRRHGSLTVAKVVDWNGIAPDAGKTFQVCISGPSFPGGDCKTIGYDGGTLQWDDLIPGSYSVSEGNPGGEWTVQVSGSPVTVPVDGAGASASVLNTRKLGSLRVTKTVSWKGVPADPNQSFTICIAGPSYTNGDCKSVGANGGVLTWTDLMPGAYSVAENNPGRVWETVITGEPAAVPIDGSQVSAAVINMRLQPASITVTKMLTSSDETVGWAFVMRLTSADPRTVTDKAPSTTWSDLEPNRSYVLSEDEPGLPWVEGQFECTIDGVAVGVRRSEEDIQLTLAPADHAICAKYNGLVSSGTDLDPVDEPAGTFRIYLPAVRH
ncbi:MAG: hypothetical protein U0X20_16170 [Caldilineaceae bacterium]